MGLRGANDTEMAPGGPDANRALLERIVDRAARHPARRGESRTSRKVPQLWALYKEVQEFYEHGMRVPDDVTLLWAEDNWGNVRRLPTAAERQRRRRRGHLLPLRLPRRPAQLPVAQHQPAPEDLGADVAGEAVRRRSHLDRQRRPLQGLRVADGVLHQLRAGTPSAGMARTSTTSRGCGPRASSARSTRAAIADLVAKYTKYNGRRKPEMLAPDTFSLSELPRGRDRAGRVAARWPARRSASDAALPATMQDAYYQLVLFPVQASALVNETLPRRRPQRSCTRSRAAPARAATRSEVNDTVRRVHATDRRTTTVTSPAASGRTSWTSPCWATPRGPIRRRTACGI